MHQDHRGAGRAGVGEVAAQPVHSAAFDYLVRGWFLAGVEPPVTQDLQSVLRGSTFGSHGIAEGVVRVVTDPSFEDVEPGEILVTSTTDPSWPSIMYVSAALVVDIGGALSHAAVVARELAIPCVVSTGDGTRVLRTGDRVRVDGTTGTVTILQPARRS